MAYDWRPMNYLRTMLAATLAVGLTFALAGCPDDGPLEDAADETEDAAEDAAEEVEDAAEDAGDKMDEATD